MQYLSVRQTGVYNFSNTLFLFKHIKITITITTITSPPITLGSTRIINPPPYPHQPSSTQYTTRINISSDDEYKLIGVIPDSIHQIPGQSKRTTDTFSQKYSRKTHHNHIMFSIMNAKSTHLKLQLLVLTPLPPPTIFYSAFTIPNYGRKKENNTENTMQTPSARRSSHLLFSDNGRNMEKPR